MQPEVRPYLIGQLIIAAKRDLTARPDSEPGGAGGDGIRGQDYSNIGGFQQLQQTMHTLAKIVNSPCREHS